MIIKLLDDVTPCESHILTFESYFDVKRWFKDNVDSEKNSERVFYTRDERVLDCIMNFEIDKYEKHNSILLVFKGVEKPLRDCTNKEIRVAHNLRRMYVANSFS